MAAKFNVPATRLPVTDIHSAGAALADVYDKLGSVQNQTNQVVSAQSAQSGQLAGLQSNLKKVQVAQAATGQPFIPAFRTVQTYTFITASDYTVKAFIGSGVTFTLPDARVTIGQVFVVVNDAASSANVTMASIDGQFINGGAASGVAIAPGFSLVFQSDGQNWIMIARF